MTEKHNVELVMLAFDADLRAELTYRKVYDKRYPQVICKVDIPKCENEKFYYISDTPITLEQAKKWAVESIVEYLEKKENFYAELKNAVKASGTPR